MGSQAEPGNQENHSFHSTILAFLGFLRQPLGVSREDVESLEGADFTESPHEILDWVCDKLADWSKGQPLSFEDLKSDTRNDYLKRTCA